VVLHADRDAGKKGARPFDSFFEELKAYCDKIKHHPKFETLSLGLNKKERSFMGNQNIYESVKLNIKGMT